MIKFLNHLVTGLKWIGAVSIAGMMLLTCADVIMRAFGRPIFGAVEVCGFLATIALACAMPYTHTVRGHVGVDMIVRRLSIRKQGIIDTLTGLASMVLFGIVSWRAYKYAGTIKQSGEVSMTLEFPSYIFVYFIGFAFSILTLVILPDIINAVKNIMKTGDE